MTCTNRDVRTLILSEFIGYDSYYVSFVIINKKKELVKLHTRQNMYMSHVQKFLKKS